MAGTTRACSDMFAIATWVVSGKTWTGIPVIAANMDTTGTFEMAKVFAKHKMMVAMSKHISVDEVWTLPIRARVS